MLLSLTPTNCANFISVGARRGGIKGTLLIVNVNANLWTKSGLRFDSHIYIHVCAMSELIGPIGPEVMGLNGSHGAISGQIEPQMAERRQNLWPKFCHLGPEGA